MMGERDDVARFAVTATPLRERKASPAMDLRSLRAVPFRLKS